MDCIMCILLGFSENAVSVHPVDCVCLCSKNIIQILVGIWLTKKGDEPITDISTENVLLIDKRMIFVSVGNSGLCRLRCYKL